MEGGGVGGGRLRLSLSLVGGGRGEDGSWRGKDSMKEVGSKKGEG